MKHSVFLVIFMFLLTACGTAVEEEDHQEGEAMQETWRLLGEFDKEEYSWHLEFENVSEDAIVLDFRSGQEIEVIISNNEDEEAVYHYSADKMFSQALKTVTVDPRESRTWEGDVPKDVLEPGKYTITFEVVADKINGEERKNPIQTSKIFELQE